ncbi:putative transporter YycB [Frondihabitans sp. 762G35]|uniref:MFS transporter n=1 Tax=Frondihabitans sp. 762G35 TaxID=1446794 RepID=UPI000D222AFD|nr:MFS transporter [Frondihabitans sp. 762G35]ARC55543.1 putative transporter YycB [Frondihabitans sp. 762G35]
MNRAATIARSPAAWLLTVAIVLVALNLRGPIVATAPVLDIVKSDLGIGAVLAGLLTSIPVLCFAVASPLASGLIGRLGPERAVTLSLLGVLTGTLVRSGGTQALLIVGTVIIGVSITIGNVVVPVVIRRDFSAQRTPFVTGIYTSALNVGSMITSLGTAPIASATGWPLALIAWSAFAVIAGAVWILAVGLRKAFVADDSTGFGELVTGPVEVITASIPTHGGDPVGHPAPSLFRRLSTWGLTLAFAGQAFAYYGLTAWMPTLLHDEVGLSREGAGASSSVFQILAVVGALGVPFLALRFRPVYIVALVGLLWIAMPLGLLVAPQLWLVWSIIGGAAQGGGITIIFIVIVRMVTSDVDARRLSALVQGGGYAIASLGPLVVGAVHDATGAWTLPMAVVLVSVLTLGISGVLSARRVH